MITDAQRESEWIEFRELWKSRLLVAGFISCGIAISVHLYFMMMRPESRCTGLYVMCGLGMFWSNRGHLKSSVTTGPRGLGRFLLFPGYLVSISFVVIGIAIAIRMASLLAVAGVLALGWMLAKRCDANGWRQLSPSWLLLLVSSLLGLPWGDYGTGTKSTLDAASRLIDAAGCHHLLGIDSLLLIDSREYVSLSSSVFLSGTCLVGAVACLALLFRVPLLIASIAIMFAIVAQHALLPARIISAAAIDSLSAPVEKVISWVGLDLASQILAMLAVFTLLFVALAWLNVILNPIALHPQSRDSATRIVHGWNRFASVMPSEFLLGYTCRSLDSRTYVSLDFHAWAVFCRHYVFSRRWYHVAALSVCTLACVWCLLLSGITTQSLPNNEQLGRTYRQQFADSLNDKEFETALHFYHRLLQFNPTDCRCAIEIADKLLVDGQALRAVTLVETAAEASEHQVDLRHWLIRYHLRQGDNNDLELTMEQLSDEHIIAAEKQLIILQRQSQLSTPAMITHALLLCQMGKRPQAEQLLQAHKEGDRKLAIDVARVQWKLGFEEGAKARAREVAIYFKAREAVSLTVEEIICFAESQALCGDWTSAVDVLESGLLHSPSEPRLVSAIVPILIRLADSPSLDDETERVRICRRIAELDDHNDSFQALIARRMFSSETQPEQELATLCRKWMRRWIESSTADPNVFVILGTGAAKQGKYDIAQKYLQLAYDCGDRTSALMNNLAWVLTQQTPVNWGQALKLANQAVATDPRSEDARLTRADIYIAVERFTDALVDLEIAYQRQRVPDIAKRIAVCYAALNEPDLANLFLKESL